MVNKLKNDKRPVNLDLGAFRFPLPAITSILHRISGFALFFAMIFLLYALQLSLKSEQSFIDLQALLATPLAKLFAWLILTAIAYHFVAGIKHLLMDVGIGEELGSGLLAARLTLFIGIILAVLAGVWIW